ncbi:MAG TPA: DNA mismatch repair endonuclease MutL [Bacteroidota bacterium]|nr:DNA mismatch repair endonuclease MutL [Bacteroidota bacterium]
MSERRVTVLPEHVANRIAAGEVVQRPSSVVKELLENSIDAGAASIVLSVREGGSALIQVSDDGRGMDEQDARASFLRHATSKIAAYEDLESVATFGFRGEALASIAAVARVSMKTRRQADEAAVVVKIDGGGPPRVEREAREPGTTVTVQNLFFNVPARRKFLKSPATEFRHVYEEVQRIALSRPSIALHFVNDDETVFRLKPAPLETRLADVLGQRRCEGLLPVEETGERITVHGYIGKPAFGMRTRQGQFLFLNGRFILSRTINAAVFSAYEHLLVKGSFPFFLLFLEVDPHRVDINVHPSKLEAKFEDEQSLFRFVSAMVRRALAAVPAVPALTIAQEGIEPGTVAARFTPRQHAWPGDAGGTPWTFPERPGVDTRTGEILPFVPSDRVAEPGSREDHPLAAAGFPAGADIAASLLQRPDSRGEGGGPALIWQLHNKYILSQIRNGLMIVDQHVAHERVLYERALGRLATSARSGQQLLFPVTLELSPPDMALLEELLPELDLLGFTIRPFGRNTVVIDGVPPDTRAGAEGKLVEEMLALYKEYRQNDPASVRDNLAKSYSCRSAIKAGDPLTEEEMRSLIDQLFATQMPYVCPHGRPVVLRISIEELDRRFGRTT